MVSAPLEAQSVSAPPPNTETFTLTFTLTMPYTKSEFDSAKQDKFKASVASAAGTIASNVDILSITEERRRAGGIDIETKICAADEAGMDKMSESLGSGDAVKTKINTELKKQGLREATASTSLSSSSSQNSKNGVKNSEGWFIITGCVGLVVLLCLCACCFRFQKCARSEEKLASRAVELSSAPEPMDPETARVSGIIGFDGVVSGGETGPGASLPPPPPQTAELDDGESGGGVGLQSSAGVAKQMADLKAAERAAAARGDYNGATDLQNQYKALESQ